MKRLKAYSVALLMVTAFLKTTAQTAPNLEFATAQGTNNPTGNGPVNTTTITFVANTDNPSANTFQTNNPALTATFTVSNQRYNNAVSFGAGSNNSAAAIFPLMNYAGAAANSVFTSSGAATGTGIDTSANRGVNVLFFVGVLNGNPTNATYDMADMTITFNRPVNNPILHIAGMGGAAGALGFTGGFDYISSNVPVTFTRLSGNSTNFAVTSNSIKNNAANPTASGNNSGSGSVRINGTGITTISLKLSARGDGNAGSWGPSSGDGLTVALSTLESDMAIVKTVDNQNPDRRSNVVFTLTATNNGPSNNTGILAKDLLPSGYTFISANPGAGTYDSTTGNWAIGNLNTGASSTLTITAQVNCDGNYTNTATITGDNSDPVSSNNSSSITPNVSLQPCACYNDPNKTTTGIDSKVGITLLKRAGSQENNWPMVRKSAHLVLESNTKGFVITRMPTAELANITIPVEGMMVYDTTAKCLKIYSDNTWSCFSTTACP